MKKLLLLIVIASLLNGCRYVDTKEQYIDAKESSTLIIPAGKDSPNSISTLKVPSPGSKEGMIASNDRNPPVMPVRVKQSDDGTVKIENINGSPVLSVKTNKSNMWAAMSSLEVDNWTYVSKDEEQCEVKLDYNDLAARERDDANLVRKLLSRDKFYADHTGTYKFICSGDEKITQAKFTKVDGTTADTFLSDKIMTKLYEKFQ